MHKYEMKISIKRANHGDFPFSNGYSLNSVEKSYGLKQAHFLTLLIFKIFLKNYPAKLEIKGLTERKNQLCESILCKRLCIAF